MTNEVLSVSQAAEELGRPARTILRWITDGKIEATKLGTGRTAPYVIRREDVARAKAQRPAGTHPPKRTPEPSS